MSEPTTPTSPAERGPLPAEGPTLPHQGGGGEKRETAGDLTRRLEALRATLDAKLTRFDLVWLLSEVMVFHEWRGGSFLDAADRAEADILARAAGLKDLRRSVARTKRLRRLGVRIDSGEFDAPKRRRRRKKKAVR